MVSQTAPRYTSYPTAPHFSEAVTAETYQNWLAALPAGEPVSLYLHVPFCNQLCWYCGCNTRVVNSQSPAEKYAQLLEAEITMVAGILGRRQPVGHLHWGGGTPTTLPPAAFGRISRLLEEKFTISPQAQRAVELDPRHVSENVVAMLAQAGINRASLGVQDFNADVQAAINRVQPFEKVQDVVKNLHSAGIEALNFDLMYGLPLQTVETLLQTVDMAVSLAPSRVSLFGYAHVPWMRPAQKMLEKYPLPNHAARLEMATQATERLRKQGYVPIGMDHFARPEDSLSKALSTHTLSRNFQGYTDDPSESLLGFGASSIGQLPGGYVQNTPSTKDYATAIEDGALATVRGIATDADDKLRRRLIEQLMCYFEVDVDALGATGAAVLAGAMPHLHPLMRDGLARCEEGKVIVTPKGQPFVRLIAACFDTYLHNAPQKARHSAAV